MGKVVCIGEAIVDFIPNDSRFVPTAGGAPANVSACVAKLGGHACYLGKLSKDAYGFFLLDNMKKHGIDTRYVVLDDQFKSPLAFVSLRGGDRSFSFLRDNTADLNLCEDEIDADMLVRGDILHFCSVCLVESKTKYTHKNVIEQAKVKGVIISFDVNMRPALWRSEDDMLNAICEFLQYADIIKFSQEEFDMIGKFLGAERESNIVKAVFDIATTCKFMFVTKGGDGACVYDVDGSKISMPAMQAKVKDTTGAGDCFIGSVLYLLSQHKALINMEQMKNVLSFALSACSLQVERYGGINAMPALEEVVKNLPYSC